MHSLPYVDLRLSITALFRAVYFSRLVRMTSIEALIKDASKPIASEPNALTIDLPGFPYVGTTPATPVSAAVFKTRPPSSLNSLSASLLTLCEIHCVAVSTTAPAAPAARKVAPAVAVADAVAGNARGITMVAVAATAPNTAPSNVLSSTLPPVVIAVYAPAIPPISADTPINKPIAIADFPVWSHLLTGLLRQYANILYPKNS